MRRSALALAEQRSSAEQTSQALRGQIHAMRAKHAEARRKLASLSAGRQMVEAGRALHGMAGETSRGTNGFARFERMHQQIDQAEAEAHALVELYDSPVSRWEAEAESHEQARRVEAEITAIKERLRRARSSSHRNLDAHGLARAFFHVTQDQAEKVAADGVDERGRAWYAFTFLR